ncbi:MAG: xanthine dehydrogenase family protein molybdopterin-binding subunit [Chloroflexi bacterium]|nr:xanthine dehydrogenase family protein molybdopterin-binding subunit [Chloroflexota bacterium]
MAKVGTSVKRCEDPRLLAGAGRFVADVVLPRMLEVAFVRSPHAHARLASVDVSAALAVPGVVAVLTGDDLPTLVTPYRGALSHHPGMKAAEIWPLARGKVRFVGEPIVAIAAANRYLAEDACDRVEVRYEPLATVLDPEAALAADAPLIYEELGTNRMYHREFNAGRVEDALASAPVLRSEAYSFGRQTGAPIEPRGVLAEYDRVARTLTVWISTQAPHMVQAVLSQVTGVELHHVRVIAPDVGGGFGMKLHTYQDEVATCVLAMSIARPLKWVSDRREALLTDAHAREHRVQVQVGADRLGKILGMRAAVQSTVGPTSVFPRTSVNEGTQVARLLPGPYRLANYACTLDVIAQNKGYTGAYRSVGHPIAMAVTESVLDSVADALRLDPLELRFHNFIDEAEIPYTTATGHVYDSGSYARALAMLAKEADYRGLRAFQERRRTEGRLVGIGLCCYVLSTASGAQSSYGAGGAPITAHNGTTIRLEPNGKATVLIGITTQGQGTLTTTAQLVADELGLEIDDIRVISGDTAIVPYGAGASGSRTAATGGTATVLAARALREKILGFAGALLEVTPDDLELVAGEVRVKGMPERSIALRSLAQVVYYRTALLPTGLEPSLEANKRFVNPRPHLFTNGVNLAMVEVDPETGLVDILRYVVVCDCGRMINPRIVEAQVRGGIAQGIGGALYERIVYDAQGQNLTSSLMDYLVPTAAEVPSIAVFHVPPADPRSQEIRGIGEAGVAGAPGAMLNAVNDALKPRGARIRELPITPELILAALRASGSQAS